MCKVDHIDLWTLHSADFQPDRDRVDLTKSMYLPRYPKLVHKYNLVREYAGTDQLVWCSVVPSEPLTSYDKRVVWKLRVPILQTVCFVDEFLAYYILERNTNPCVSIPEWQRLRQDATQLYPNRQDRQSEYIDSYLSQDSRPRLDISDAWRGFILDEPEIDEAVAVILRCPIDPSWITQRPIPQAPDT